MSAQPPGQTGTDQSSDTIDIHKPFTPSERIQQLLEIDMDVANLLDHLSSVLRAMAAPPGTSVNQPTTTNPSDSDISLLSDSEDNSPLQAFRKAQDAFFNTIDRVDKQLTRQILALEEAGIVTLKSAADQGPEQEGQGPQQQQLQGAAGQAKGSALPVNLEPDGMGRYGQLEVGQLNLASSTVERDREAELWRGAREHLTKILGQMGVPIPAVAAGDAMEE